MAVAPGAGASTASGDGSGLDYLDDGRSSSEQCPPPASATTAVVAEEEASAAAAAVVPQNVTAPVPIDAGEEASTAAAVVEVSANQQTPPTASPSPDVARAADDAVGELYGWFLSCLLQPADKNAL